MEKSFNKSKLAYVWMRQFKRVIHLFEGFEFLLRKIIRLDEKIKKEIEI